MLEKPSRRARIKWGILGGIGPLASASFLATVYNARKVQREQEMPSIIMLSQPDMPDRTELLLSNRGKQLYKWLERSLHSLMDMGAERLLLCCYTLHQVVPLLPVELRKRVLDLPDLALSLILKENLPTLLLCTNGCRKFRIFEQRPLWQKAHHLISFPSEPDQLAIHSVIYKLKTGMPPDIAKRRLAETVTKYEVSRCLLGCTDLHLLPGTFPCKDIRPIDPLLAAAEIIWNS